MPSEAWEALIYPILILSISPISFKHKALPQGRIMVKRGEENSGPYWGSTRGYEGSWPYSIGQNNGNKARREQESNPTGQWYLDAWDTNGKTTRSSEFPARTTPSLATCCEELTLWKRAWCWERLQAGGEGDNRGWDGWMASPTQWTWAWASSRRWWWTGRPGVLQSSGLQRVGQDWATELNWTMPSFLKLDSYSS